MTTPDTPSTQLRPPWLNITRGLWIVLSAASFVLLSAFVVASWAEPLPSCADPNAIVCGPWAISAEDIAMAQQLGLPGGLLQTLYLAIMLLVKLIFFAVGVMIFVLRSEDWMAQLLSLTLTMFILEGIHNLGALMPLVSLLYAVPTVLFFLLPFIFPSGRIVPRWVVWLLPPLLLVALSTSIVPLLRPGLVTTELYSYGLLVGWGTWFAAAAYAVVYRYKRVSTPTERQQTKWVLAGLLVTFVLFIPYTVVLVQFPPSQPSPQRLIFMFLIFMPVYIVSYLGMPAGVAFAILRYRLWDIDVIVRKTLIYTVLTGLLALVFFGVVTLLSGLLSAVTGQQSALAVVVSTLVIAALFNPLRRRVQEGIDRRFFRKKYDAQQVLAQFALFARNETDLDALTGELTRVIQETLQPESVSIWLRRQ